MTIAEALEARGEARAMVEVAKSLLKEGLDKVLIVKTTNLDMNKIEELSQQIESKT